MTEQETTPTREQVAQETIQAPMRRGRVSVEAVKKELTAKKKSLRAKLLTLAITLFIFASAGLLTQNPVNLAMIVLVLLIHETGHWIGMKIFKYNDVQMFFIPGFGAAVSGTAQNPCARQKAIVSLLGPIPGIIIGVLCIVVYVVSRNPIWAVAADMFLLVNSFNLLPIYPLDGGRFVEAILFTRHPRAEVGFKLVAALVLAYLAYQWKSIALGLLAYLSFISIKYVMSIAQSSKALQNEPVDAIEEDADKIPDEWLEKIIRSLDGTLPDTQRNPKTLASAAKTIWDRLRMKHCSIKAAIGLGIVYLLFLAPYTGLMVLSNIARTNSAADQEQQPAKETSVESGSVQDATDHP